MELTDTRLSRQFSAGTVTVTLKSAKTGKHITLRFRCMARTDRWVQVPLSEAAFVFVSEGSRRVARFRVTDGALVLGNAAWSYLTDDYARVWAVQQVLAAITPGGEVNTNVEITTASVCGCCNRKLTDPVSIERGIGPECYGKLTGSHYAPHAQGKLTPLAA